MVQPHFLVVTFPAQGHINPGLQLAKRLMHHGAAVTFATCVSAQRSMGKTTLPEGLSITVFSDGYDDGFSHKDDPNNFMTEFRRRGSQSVSDMIKSCAKQGKPVSCLVHTLLLPWAVEVAREHNIPWALLWIQPAMVFDIYYYYFIGYRDVFSKCGDPSYAVELPGLPPLIGRDLPSFLIPSNVYTFALPTFQEQVEMLNKEANPIILVNTFNALEPESLKAIEKLNLIGVGPLIPSAYLDGNDPSDTSFGGDLFQPSEDCMEWLNSRPKSSVVYVSFGSIALLSVKQMEEIAHGLLDSGHPFLWVIREDQKEKVENHGENDHQHADQVLSCREELKKQGMIVRWCSQLEVLSHPSLGCFVTHCGWNSTLESLASGVPVVAFPQWTDQGTNAKLIGDVWQTGARVASNQEGIVERDEFRRCLNLIMEEGEIREELRKNAKKWKDLAREALKDGGSSDRNLKEFVSKFGEGLLKGSI